MIAVASQKMNDGSATTIEGSPGRSPLDLHRFVVAGATFDEFDAHQKYETGSSSGSVASTVDVDNTHPYLMRYADMYAHDNSDASSVSTGPTFVGVKPPSRFQKGQKVLYSGSNGPSEAIVVKVLYDDENQPHYTIKLASGQEEQTPSENLDRKNSCRGATDENGDVPIKCVNFKTNPTTLFQSLYDGKWEDAQKRLQTNPSEASIWVARYSKRGPGSYDEGDVRWQLLPLHLYIALGGRSNDEAKTTPGNDELPDDEKDEIERMQKEIEEGKIPPLQLIVALLAAYPQATQCTDDQNMIPLQSAIRGNVSLSIIEKLLEVDPSSVYRKDVRGRNAFVLAEKVYGKRIHKQPVGKENKAREMKYTKLMTLLSDAARHVSSPAKSQPNKERVQLIQKKTQEEAMKKLQNENLALRRENAEMHHRAEINSRLLQQLVEKLQMYEEQRSVDIENYNEIFGSAYELADRREGILHSISEDDDVVPDKDEEEKEQIEEKQVIVGGDGAYHKRLERYQTLTPTSDKSDINIVSPASAVTEATEPATPPPTPSVLLPKLNSWDEYDANHTSDVECNEGVTLEDDGEEVKILEGSGVEEEGNVLGDVEETKEDEIGSMEHSESDESGNNANTEGQDIFRPREADTQDVAVTAKAESPTAFLGDVDMTEAADDDKASANTAPPAESSTAPEPEVVSKEELVNSDSEKQIQANISTDAKGVVDSDRPAILPVLSKEEEEQLCVE